MFIAPYLIIMYFSLHSLFLSLSLSYLIKAQPLETLESVVDVSYSYELHGLAIVLSSGKVAFVTGSTAKFEPQVSTCINNFHVF